MRNFSVQNWNTQNEVNFTGFTSSRKIISNLEKFSADIITLQEMCDAKEIVKNISNLKTYNTFIPRLNLKKDNGFSGHNYNVILSKHPIVKTEEICFPKFNGRVLENCSVAHIQIDSQIVRIYNCHFGIFRVGIATRLKQLEYILSEAQKDSGPVIICGDMNVTIPKLGWNRKIIRLWHQEPKREMFLEEKLITCDEREVFNQTIEKYGFREVLDLYQPTWSPFKTKKWQLFQLKLDWFIVKNLDVSNVKLGDYVSDHRQIEAECCLNI